MSLDHHYLNLPYPLKIVIDVVPGDRYPQMRATSPDWPSLLGVGDNFDDAVAQLLPQVSDTQPLKARCIDALRGAGYDESTIDAWSRHITGYRLWRLRNDGNDAVSRLQEYASLGIAPATACHFLGIGFNPYWAEKLTSKDVSPESAAPFVDRLADFWADFYGEPMPLIIADNQSVVVAWILSGFNPDEADFYQQAFASPNVARAWRALVEKYTITAEDLRDIIRVGFRPEEVDESAGHDDSGAFLPAEAARTMLALGAPNWASQSQGYYTPVRDPSATDDPWGAPQGWDGSEPEPPF